MGPEHFDFSLPPAQVAQRPAVRRGDARLMVVGPPHVHGHVRDLIQHLPDDALVVVNDSRVRPARLRMRRTDGRAFELLICDPRPALGPGDELVAWVRGARYLEAGDRLVQDDLTVEFRRPDERDPRGRWFLIRTGTLDPVLDLRGEVPLPPYIERPHGPTPEDAARYQTRYARHDGSVAAPTAGLHLDDELVQALDPVRVTLHVGPGTFLPMSVDDVRFHRVRGERYVVSEGSAMRLNAARQEGRPIVAVGTTVVRVLESLMQRHGAFAAGSGTTELVITPDHQIAAVDAMLTNFHLPRSSLLMLACTFGGRDRVLEAYAEAVVRGYRFYSYGDCMLLQRRGHG